MRPRASSISPPRAARRAGTPPFHASPQGAWRARVTWTGLALATSVAAWASVGCGGAHAASPGHAGPKAGTAEAAFTSDVPRAAMPPPFRFTSKESDLRTDARYACDLHDATSTNTDPTAALPSVADACAHAGMHVVGAPFVGTQGQGAAAQRFKVHLTAGKCYRVYGASAAAVKNLEILLVDAHGIPAFEGRSDGQRMAAPADGAACFTSAAEGEIVVSVGAGDGAFAVELVED